MNMEQTVRERYSQGAREREESLCCPVDYDAGLLRLLPREIIERDYGCGDPSRYVRPGDTVLDLGSGGGKICYMAAQLVGPSGQVIGVDINDDMLSLARSYAEEMAARLGNRRVRFCKGYIQDLALDLESLEHYLAEHPVRDVTSRSALQAWEQRQRRERPLIADASVDLVISNCVLNLVSDAEKRQLVREIHRVLRPGGRVAIADIVSDRPVPEELKQDPELWSGCISGAFQEAEFLETFAAMGFHAVMLDKRETRPWRVIDSLEFRSVTLTAVKPHTATDTSTRTLMYRGPFASVVDDSGHSFARGVRVTTDPALHATLTGPAYGNAFVDADPEPAGAACCPGGGATHRPAGGGNGGCCG